MTRVGTAAFTWRDIFADGPHAGGLRLEAVDRDDLPVASTNLRAAVEAAPAAGGLLLWNKTLDEEGGHLVMFTGQTCAEERQVLTNAEWLISCGAVYAAARVGRVYKDGSRDVALRHDGHQLYAWLLPNDRSLR